MELHALAAEYLILVTDWWHALDFSYRYYAWLAAGVALLLLWLYASHRLMRRILGHRKWRDSWYTESEYQELINILYEDQRSGSRVMQHDEIEALRDWMYGSSFRSLGLDKRDGY